MKLGYVIIYVPDLLKTVEFYEQAFGLERKFIHESGYAELATGNTTIAFASEALRASNGLETLDNRQAYKPAGIEIALVTNNVEASYNKAITAGAQPLKKPELKLWEQVVSY